MKKVHSCEKSVKLKPWLRLRPKLLKNVNYSNFSLNHLLLTLCLRKQLKGKKSTGHPCQLQTVPCAGPSYKSWLTETEHAHYHSGDGCTKLKLG